MSLAAEFTPAPCPLCGGSDCATVLDRVCAPVFQNAAYPTASAALAAPMGRLAIRLCRRCGFVYNGAFQPDLVAYGCDYENNQTVSTVFDRHVDAMADRVLAAAAPGAAVLEVGCGQGYFLERLHRRADPTPAALIGYDPAWRGGEPPHGARIESAFFDRAAAEALDHPIGVVVSRHVIEHISDPIGFLKALRAALPVGSACHLFLETPCVAWILRHAVLQDFFYEHCSYFTQESLAWALRCAGWRPVSVETVFQDQYLWAEAAPDWSYDPDAAAPPPPDAGPLLAQAEAFAIDTNAAIDRWRKELTEHARRGRAALWGAGAKGATFAAVVDPLTELIDCLIDVNPKKQGAYIAATGHAIVDPAAAAQRGVRAVVIMNPNYRAEIEAQTAAAKLPFVLLDG